LRKSAERPAKNPPFFGSFSKIGLCVVIVAVVYKELHFVCAKALYRVNFIYLLNVQNIKFEDITEI
jgi:hypothetical protein